MTESKEPDLSEHVKKASGGGPSRTMFWAVVVVLLMVIGGLAVYSLYHPTSTGSSAQVTAAETTTVTGSAYNLTVHTNGAFDNMTVYFGDGSVTNVFYSGSNNVSLSHVYRDPGNYYIYYTVNFGSTTYRSSDSLVNVLATTSTLNEVSSIGLISLISEQSSAPLVNQSTIFSPGSHASYLIGYFTAPANTSFQVISQSITVYKNGSQTEQTTLPYVFNSSQGTYQLEPQYANFNMSSLSEGYYEILLTTYTAYVANTTTGALDLSAGVFSTNYYLDMPVFSNGALYQAPVSKTIFVNDQLAPGGYTTLDPAINYDLLGYEILDNTYQWLLTYNKSSATSYLPALATQVPTVANGGINNNYANYTQTTPWGSTYTVALQPYQNFTFHIRSNASFQNGDPVTAWDVMYSLTRTLLFNNGSPGTPGWIQAQYLLPNDYTVSNTFYNITNNMTVNNNTNNITFHFQNPMPPALVFEILETSGTWITDANWLQSIGAGIAWSPQGFLNYTSQGSESNYNQYIINHVMASGPYKISYIVPSSQVVLVANPSFTSPGPWLPAPTINEVVINYISSPSTAYLAMKAGAAQGSSFPSSNWEDVISLENAGIAKAYGFPSLGINWYSFNANVNTSMMQNSVYSGSNMPGNLFTVHNVRKAFAYSFDYNHFFNNILQNAKYNTTFGQAFAGALPAGMLYAQTVAELNATTGGNVPYFDLAKATQYWQDFLNGQDNANHFHITWTGTGNFAMYAGSPMVVPIVVQQGDPIDAAAVTVWASDLQKATGIQMPVVQLSFPDINSLSVAGQNPLPISLNQWFPDYPYPTDYLEPIAMPINSSTFMGAASFTPYWFGSSPQNNATNQTEAAQLQSMIEAYNNGSTAVNPSQAQYWFQKMNEQFVNITAIVPEYQEFEWRVISTKIDPYGINTYQSNIMVAGANIMLYTYLKYA